MEVSTFWLTLLRRWYLLLLAIACTVAATVYVVRSVGPTYAAEGTAVLFPPTTTVIEGTTVETQGNPYLMLGGLNQARDIVIRRMTSKSANETWGRQHSSSSYEVGPDYTTSGPIILMTVSGPSPNETVSGLQDLLDGVEPTLVDLQSGMGLEPRARITSRQLTIDQTPTRVIKSQIRAGILVAAITLALGLLLIGLFDGLRGRRPPRRRVAESGATDRGGRRASVPKETVQAAARSEPVADPAGSRSLPRLGRTSRVAGSAPPARASHRNLTGTNR